MTFRYLLIGLVQRIISTSRSSSSLDRGDDPFPLNSFMDSRLNAVVLSESFCGDERHEDLHTPSSPSKRQRPTSCIKSSIFLVICLATAFVTTFTSPLVICNCIEAVRKPVSLILNSGQPPSDSDFLSNFHERCKSWTPQGIHAQQLEQLEARIHVIENQLALGEPGRLDVATRGAGAYIITNLTSPTYMPPCEQCSDLHQQLEDTQTTWQWSDYLWQWGAHSKADQTSGSAASHFMPLDPIESGAVLEDTLVNGDCWQFSGHSGQVAIFLTEAIDVRGMSVHYVRSAAILPKLRKQAPRGINLWGLSHSPARLDAQHPPTTRTASSFRVFDQDLPHTISPDDTFVLILQAEYEIDRYYPIQFFSTTDWSTDTQLFEIVILEVTGNWGANITCLYHIGIHGIHTEDDI